MQAINLVPFCTCCRAVTGAAKELANFEAEHSGGLKEEDKKRKAELELRLSMLGELQEKLEDPGVANHASGVSACWRA